MNNNFILLVHGRQNEETLQAHHVKRWVLLRVGFRTSRPGETKAMWIGKTSIVLILCGHGGECDIMHLTTTYKVCCF